MEEIVGLIIVCIILTIIIYFWIKIITVLSVKYKLIRKLETLLVLGPTIIISIVVGYTYPLFI